MADSELPVTSDTRNLEQLSRKRFLRLSACAGLGAAGIGALRVSPAEAASFKTVASAAVRNGPSVLSTKVATFAAGTTVNVGSQTGGSRIGSGSYPNNATWCRLADGRWIHDVHLNTPGNGSRIALSDGKNGYVLLSNGLPRTTASILGRSTRDAVAWWAETQLGVRSYYGFCYAFARDAWRFGTNRDPGAGCSFSSGCNAIGVWNGLGNRRQTQGTPPRGAIVFWKYKTDGHAALSAGNGNVVSSWYGATDAISWATIAQVTAKTGPYLGWWLPA